MTFENKCTSSEDDVLYDLKYDGTSVTDESNTLFELVTFDTETMLITFYNSLAPLT